MKKLFLDDIRMPPDDSWTIVHNYDDCISALTYHVWDEISLDHDLGDDSKTGYDVVKWLEERAANGLGRFVPTIINIHSANPVGRKNMEAGIASIRKMQG